MDFKSKCQQETTCTCLSVCLSITFLLFFDRHSRKRVQKRQNIGSNLMDPQYTLSKSIGVISLQRQAEKRFCSGRKKLDSKNIVILCQLSHAFALKSLSHPVSLTSWSSLTKLFPLSLSFLSLSAHIFVKVNFIRK